MRVFDILLSAFGLLLLAPVFLILLFLTFIFQPGSPLYFQSRVGRGEKTFTLLKLRTMKPGTPVQGTHEVRAGAITLWGRLLRDLKLDEIPQLWNVLKGEMSLVGPRPCLPNQKDLIRKRRSKGIFHVRPGITGLAQISGVDMSSPAQLVEMDAQMLARLDVRSYFKTLACTVVVPFLALLRGAGKLLGLCPPSSDGRLRQ